MATVFASILGGVAVIAIGVIVVSWAFTRFFYRPTRQGIADLLARTVDRTARHGEVDLFISIPIASDPVLESVRLAFGKRYGPGFPDSCRAEVEAMIRTLRASGESS